MRNRHRLKHFMPTRINSVGKTSIHSQQRLFRGETLSLHSRLFSHRRMPKIQAFSVLIEKNAKERNKVIEDGKANRIFGL